MDSSSSPSGWRTIRDYGGTALAAVAFAFLVRTYVLEVFRVSNLSMSPTLISGDLIWIAKWPFQIKKNEQPTPGEIIVYAEPSESAPSPDYAKRVIGLPGDLVSIQKGRIYLNKKPLFEGKKSQDHELVERLPNNYEFKSILGESLPEDLEERKVPEGTVFVVADYRNLDIKKRQIWSFVPLPTIKGKALYIWLSINSSQHPYADAHPAIHWAVYWIPEIRLNRSFQRIH